MPGAVNFPLEKRLQQKKKYMSTMQSSIVITFIITAFKVFVLSFNANILLVSIIVW